MSPITDLLGGSADAAPGGDSFPGAFVRGLVVNNSDKKFAGMVKVEFTAWKSGKNTCTWAPVLAGYGGKSWGGYILPEIGDIVLLGFIGGNGQRPFVLGCLHPGGSELVSGSFKDKNAVKRFKTKGGIDLTLSDEADKQSVTLATPKGLTVIADDAGETVTIKDKNGKNTVSVNAKSGEVSVTADGTLTLKAGKVQLKLDGKGGALEITCDQLKVKAGMTAQVSAQQSLKLEGGMVQLQGQQTMTIKGGAMTEISGGMVKIN